MRLVHFSNKIVKRVRSNKQLEELNIIGKPNGFWVSDEDAEMSWLKWCKAEEFAPHKMKHAHSVELKSDANILIISNLKEFDKFHKTYNGRLPGRIPIRRINWEEVASKYQGIIITPYLWERRLDMECSWYYGWDCASGCIWDAKAISKIELIGGE